ncbi:MAG TPA: hypothetical protein VLB80_04985 [Candidatus Babeliales bacterium]|nr:hypothetical protein [Candidatus Babeliales bacterium]
MKNSNNNTHNGYIMIFTLLIVGAAMIVVTYVGNRGSFYLPFSHMTLAREKAKMLATSGVQVAMAQLCQPSKKQEQSAQESKTEKKDVQTGESKNGATSTAITEGTSSNQEDRDFLLRILPTLNRWQQFDLKEEIDGVDGQIKICIMCEEGKINLNRIIDFKKGTLYGTDQSGWKSIMQEICKAIERITKATDIFPAFEKAIKERDILYNDATELLTQKGFTSFKDVIFYQPPTEKKQDTIYLTDIFTVWSSSDKLEPWLFSDSLLGLLGLPRVEIDDIKKRKDQVESWVKNFKSRVNWKQDWKTILVPMYGKELQTLPKNIDSMLSTTFTPRFFSVLVHGKVGEITQSVYAILEKNKLSQDNNIEYDITIKKLYWL